MSKKEKSAKKQQENKTPELAAAKKAFEMYFKENKLDPTKDYTKDPVHGKKVTKLLAKLNKERDKVAAQYPETDPNAMAIIKRKAKKEAKKESKVDYIQKVAKKEMSAHTTKYDYPLINGKEMTATEKKKYRAEQRKAANAGTPKNNISSAQPEKGKKKSKVSEEPVKSSKKDKKIKKVKKNLKKEED